MNANSRKFIIGIIATFLCFNVLAWIAVFQIGEASQFLKVVFFDVGQGDSIFIETPKTDQLTLLLPLIPIQTISADWSKF